MGIECTSIQKQIEKIPKVPGVYLMKDLEGNILYVGKSKCLQNRVRSYFHPSSVHQPKILQMVVHVRTIDVIETSSELEALFLEARLIRQIQPKYNTRQKDCKSYPYLGITIEPFPYIWIAREDDLLQEKNCKYYGPFLDSSELGASLKILQKIFKFRTCKSNLEEKTKNRRPCLLAFIEYCSAPCAGWISQESYLRETKEFAQFLEGDRENVLHQWHEAMILASKNLEFEKAAQFRDKIKVIQNLDKYTLREGSIPGELIYSDPQRSLEMLKKMFQMSKRPRIVEGVDIAHHNGKEAVGSLVCFVDGSPRKDGYRRYRIRTPSTHDDYAMIQEILNRRFCGQDKSREHPDILLIDGGKGQLNAAIKALETIHISIPVVLSLAKKEEQIYTTFMKEPLELQKNSPIHHLLCYVRDEAHRFAQNYHHHLKSQNIRR